MGLLLGIACFVAAGVALKIAHLGTPLLKLRRLLKRDVEGIEEELEACARVTEGSFDRLRKAADSYAETTMHSRREAVAVEALKDAGARNVQWSALHEQGWTTLADVAGRSELTLQRARGIGETSAARIAEAARVVNAKIESEPLPLPAPEIPDASSRALAARALDVLESQDALGAAPHELEERAERLNGEVEKIAKKSGFWRWLFGSQGAGHLVPEYYEGHAARDQVRAELDAGLLQDAAERRGRVIDRGRLHTEDPELEARFRSRYAEACALIESVLPDGAEEAVRGGHPLAGHLPAEIAEAVLAFPLEASGLALTLRRYQAFGAKYLLHQRRSILGDEMGLGKTIEALAAIVHCRDVEEATHFIVVAPASITRNWQREIEKHTELRAWLLHGGKRDARVQGWLDEGGVALVSYATLRMLDLDAQVEQRDLGVGFVVVDEAHYMKNPAAGRSRAVRALLPHAGRVCLMSGTPMENHPQEFCSLVEALRPEVARKLQTGGTFVGETVVEPRRFHALVAPVYLRRNQGDVLRELPPKVAFEEWVDIGAAQRDIYKDAVRARNLMAMRRSVTLSHEGADSAKMRRLAELLDEHRENGRKVLVFSFFLPVLDEVARRFDALGSITGDVPADARMSLVDRFQEASGHEVLVCQIQAGGVGLNLHAASAVVLMEPQWKPSTEEQAIARAHRMGQTETVLVHRLLARNTVDERITAILDGKLDLFEAYARESLIKRASREATEGARAELVLAYETERVREAS